MTEEFDNEQALSEMLKDGILYCNSFRYVLPGNPIPCGPSTFLFVLCNDVFAWGCADGEDLPADQIEPLWKLWKSHPDGVIKWCCIQRNEQPQRPIKESMKKSGSWDAELEALPQNRYDEICREMAAKRKLASGSSTV